MIVEVEDVLSAALSEVSARILARLTTKDWDAAASESVREGDQVLMRAGVAGVTKAVNVQALEPIVEAGEVIIPIRWVATGRTGDFFPALDANLELRPTNGDGTQLRLVGTYRPPFGRAGQMVDHILMRHVAEATLRGFVRRIAADLDDSPG